MAEQLANAFKTTLNGGINSSVTSVPVVDASGHPATGDYRIRVQEGAVFEFMKVTSRVTNTLTVVRGDDGTTGTAFSSGAAVYVVLNRAALLAALAERIANTIVDAKGDILVATAADTIARKAVGADGLALVAAAAQSDGLLYASIPNDNCLINGGFNVNQKFPVAQTINTDDTYFWDQWVGLMEANTDVRLENETTIVPDGATHAAEVVIVNANKKGGIVQFLTNQRSVPLLKNATGRVSLQFKARQGVGTSIANLKAAVLVWSGTADVLTSDVVNVWGATGVTPTYVASWTSENTPSALALTTSFQTFKIENILLDTASGKNIAVFIWNDDSGVTATHSYIIADVKLEAGSICTEYTSQDFQSALWDSQEFYWKTFPYVVAPAQNTADQNGAFAYAAPVAGQNSWAIPMRHPRRMFAAPTMTSFSPNAANALWWNDDDNAASGACALARITETGFYMENEQAVSDDIGAFLLIHVDAVARL